MADRLWAEMPYTGKPITQGQLAKLLKGFKVRPKQVRFGGEETFKGYMLDQFDNAWRYIPTHAPSHPENAETPKQRQKSAKFAETKSETNPPDVSAPETNPPNVSANVSAKMAENGQCFGVSSISDPVYTRASLPADDDPFAGLKGEKWGLSCKKRTARERELTRLRNKERRERLAIYGPDYRSAIVYLPPDMLEKLADKFPPGAEALRSDDPKELGRFLDWIVSAVAYDKLDICEEDFEPGRYVV
jgi:hypothetical protein